MLAVAYVLTGLLGLHFASAGPQVTLLWAPSGIAVAACVLMGARALPWVFAAALLTHALADGLQLGDLLIAAGNTAEAGLALLLLRGGRFKPSLRRPRDLAVWFVGGVVLAPALGAVLGLASLSLTGTLGSPALATFQTWWMGDGAGVLVVSPFVFAWASPWKRELGGRRWAEAGTLTAGALLACAAAVLGLPSGGTQSSVMALLPLPFLVWAALRFGQRGTSAFSLGLAAISMVLPALAGGGLRSGDPDAATIIWTATCAYAASGLLLSVVNQAQAAALERLAAEEERLSLATRSARVGVWDWDLRNGQIVRNRETMSMLGLADYNLDGSHASWRRRVHPIDLPRLDAAWEAHARGEADRYEVDLRLLDAQGRWHWIRDTGLIVRRDEENQPLRAAGTQTDIHAEKTAQIAEAALRRLARDMAAAATPAQAAAAMDARVRDLVEADAVALYMLDVDGETLRPARTNPGDASGFRDCALDVAQSAIAAPQGPDPFRAAGGPASARHDQPIVVEGEWIGVLSVRGLSGGALGGAVAARLAAAADHSAGALLRLRAEQQRAELQRQVLHTQKLESLGVLAGGIAHDFNNMLATILGNTGVALLDLDPDHPAHAPLEDVQTAANRAAELCRGLLAYAGRGQTRTEIIPLNDMVEEMERLIDAGRRKKAHLVFDLAPDLPTVEGDAAQLRQVVLNLITNASDALGPDGGTVTVRTRRVHLQAEELARTWVDDGLAAGPYLALTVADTGSGMPPGVLARIFDPFFTTKFTGRGLGLAAVLGILRSHKAAVVIETAPGEGTTFTVDLPASNAPAPTSAPAESTPHTPAGRALVVDDEGELRTLVRRVLGAAGWLVDEAPDGAAGVERVRADDGDYDLVVLDLTMPRMGGTEALEHMRAHRPHVKVLLTSGYTEDQTPQRVSGDPDTGFLATPWSPEALHRAVGLLLAPT